MKSGKKNTKKKYTIELLNWRDLEINNNEAYFYFFH